MSAEERWKWIAPQDKKFSLTSQCRMLGLARSTWYYKPQAVDPSELKAMNLIDAIYTKRPFLGSRRIVTVLEKDYGLQVNRKRVQRFMQLMGIQGLAPGPNTSRPRIENAVYPYLLKDVEIVRPNQVWSVDITYIGLEEGFAYLVAIMDWFSRFVVSWRLSNSLELAFCLDALDEALIGAKPDIFNSDQGCQFTSLEFTAKLKCQGIKISMDSKGRAFDNIFVERLWRTVKYEDIYLKRYETMKEVQKGLQEYFHYYNSERYHHSLNKRTPLDVYINS